MSNENMSGCRMGYWVLAAVIGVLTAVLLTSIAHYNLWAAIFLGLLAFGLLGLLFVWLFCSPVPSAAKRVTAAAAGAAASGAAVAAAQPSSPAPVAAAAPAAPAAAAPAPVAAEAPKDEPAKAAAVAAPAEAASMVKPSTALAGEADLKSRKGNWRYEGGDATAATEAPNSAATEKAAAATDWDGDGVAEGAAEGSRPEGLKAARGGKADNLKEIKGVGPKLEKLLNSMGFWHFDQIAASTGSEIAWLNANLEGFKGRVTRDDWVGQARILAAGGETEFSKRVDDGKVY